jgi:Serine dehydrogenase proteinase
MPKASSPETEDTSNGSSSTPVDVGTDTLEPAPPATAEQQTAPPTPKPPSLVDIIEKGDEKEIRKRLRTEIERIIKRFSSGLGSYCILSLYEPEDSIEQWDLNRIYGALEATNPKRDKDVLLFLVSPGGEIEPAYQIAKLCKTFACERFVVAVPRSAKSAATLLALGADQIHMGLLGQLGPIDPQLGNLPALGVQRALETIASICEKSPGSSEMFAKYLSSTVTIEQIGYCQRVAESAVQYAEILLANKGEVGNKAKEVASFLVHGYKDHSFVIDIQEARSHLGEPWIIGESPEITFAERLYRLLDQANVFLRLFQKKRMALVGGLLGDCVIWPNRS